MLGLAASLVLVSILPAAAAADEAPEAFVRRVYARYGAGGPGVSLERPGGDAFYAAGLLDALAKAQAKVPQGDIGPIDDDPICACQDYTALRVDRIAVGRPEGDRVEVRVAFTDGGARSRVTLTLTRTPAGWRIADVGDRGIPSIMAVLRNAIAHPGGTRTSAPKP